ncbi:hypothetical protein [Falsiroseomonas sp. CW058]|uniref:hypothetical protein n=1 Tax=Falsiroseomonas sp. CW058 TaxID=3388664 RepID=UPI003D3198B4
MRAAATLATLMAALPAAAQGPGWEGRVRDLAPALRACLADRPGAMVVEAWPAGSGRTGARLLLPGGGREDCLAGPGAVEGRRPVEPGDRLPGEGLRAFMLERRCADAWRVEDVAGRELGWLAYPGCG